MSVVLENVIVDVNVPDVCFDLYFPSSATIPAATSATRYPLFVFIHGGLWVSRDKRDYAGFGRQMALRGYACAVVNYRLSKPENDVRRLDHAHDVASILRYLHTHAEALNLDVGGHRGEAGGMTVCGHSCGAHMAGMFALQPSRFQLEGVRVRNYIGVEGLYDLAQFANDFPAWASELHVPWTEDRAAWVSPQAQTPDAAGDRARWLVVHAPADQHVNMAQSSNFVAKLRTLFDTVVFADTQLGAHFDAVAAVDETLALPAAAQLVGSIMAFVGDAQ